MNWCSGVLKNQDLKDFKKYLYSIACEIFHIKIYKNRPHIKFYLHTKFHLWNLLMSNHTEQKCIVTNPVQSTNYPHTQLAQFDALRQQPQLSNSQVTKTQKVLFDESRNKYLLFHVNGEDGISTPEQLRIFLLWVLIGEHDYNATFPVLQMLYRFMFWLQLQLCKEIQVQLCNIRIFRYNRVIV